MRLPPAHFTNPSHRFLVKLDSSGPNLGPSAYSGDVDSMLFSQLSLKELAQGLSDNAQALSRSRSYLELLSTGRGLTQQHRLLGGGRIRKGCGRENECEKRCVNEAFKPAQHQLESGNSGCVFHAPNVGAGHSPATH